MDENEPESVPDSPRFPLPDGCKDLLQAIYAQGPLRWESRPESPKAHFTLSKYPLGSPANVVLRELLLVSDLAEAINLPVQDVIRVFMQFHIFVAPNNLIEFETAKYFCSLCGVEASLAT